MMFVRLFPVVLSAVLLAAHFLRYGALLLALAVLLLPLLLLERRPWVPRVMQVLLLVGALAWVRTGVGLARERMARGEPWTRMAVILVAVALVTGLSALVFRLPAVRTRYQGD
jgi:hypothetical protein